MSTISYASSIGSPRAAGRSGSVIAILKEFKHERTSFGIGLLCRPVVRSVAFERPCAGRRARGVERRNGQQAESTGGHLRAGDGAARRVHSHLRRLFVRPGGSRHRAGRGLGRWSGVLSVPNFTCANTRAPGLGLCGCNTRFGTRRLQPRDHSILRWHNLRMGS